MPGKTIPEIAAEWANKILASRTATPYADDYLAEDLEVAVEREAVRLRAEFLPSAGRIYAHRNGIDPCDLTDADRIQLATEIGRCLCAASTAQLEIDRRIGGKLCNMEAATANE